MHIVNSSAGTPSVFLTGLRLGKSTVSSGSWVNDLACGKDFKKVPEAARGLQGTELTTHTGLLFSLVLAGWQEGSIQEERGERYNLFLCTPGNLGVRVLAWRKPIHFPKRLAHLVYARWIVLF